MIKCINILSAFLVLISCTTKKEFKEASILFYPSSGGDAIYSITLKGDDLLITNNEPRDSVKIFSFGRILTRQEVHDVNYLIEGLQKRNNVDAEIILDSWRVEVIVDGVKYYNESGIQLSTLPKDIKQLFEILVKGSTVKIDLFGFS